MRYIGLLLEKLSQAVDCPQIAWHRLKEPRHVSFNLAKSLYQFARTPAGSRVQTVLDVGANEGQFAYMARLAWPQSVIHSYEPFPAAASAFQHKHGVDGGIHLHPFALGDKKTSMPLYLSSNSANNSLLRPLDVEALKSQTIAVQTLDGNFPQPSPGDIILKIDVQGAEAAVLNGAKESLGQIRYILLEISLVPLYEQGQEIDAIWHQLRKAGYLYHSMFDEYRDPVRGTITQLDVLFERRESA